MSNPNVENIHRIALGKIEGDNIQQYQHGDWHTTPQMQDAFETTAERNAWIMSLQAETVDFDVDDLQSWVYVADYTVHPLTPYTTNNTAGPFYVHARINKDNKIEFGIFTSVATGSNAKPMQHTLGQISEHSYQEFIHGDQQAPTLRIATKAESEKMLLSGGKLKKSACPKYVGCLMNMGGTIIKLTIHTTRTIQHYDGSTTTESITDAPWYEYIYYYGHLWTYWASIIDNTLYFVGIALYDGSDSGTYVYTKAETATTTFSDEDGATTTRTYSNTRASLSLPPTTHDLKSLFYSNGWLRGDDYVSTPSSPLYTVLKDYFSLSSTGTFSTSNFDAESWLNDNCDTSSDTTLCTRVIAKIQDGVLHQCHHGDINARMTAWSYKGGVYASADGLTIAGLYDYTASFASYENNDENALTGTYNSGSSGYVCSRTVYDRIGSVKITAQYFYGSNRAYNYTFYAIGGTTSLTGYPGTFLSGAQAELTGTYKDTIIYGEEDDEGGDLPTTPEAGDIEEEEDIEEPPEGLLAEYYDYQLGSDVADYPISITMSPNMIDLRSYFEANTCYDKSDADELASDITYEIKLNEDSRYLKTPAYSYTVTVTAGGQDGPFEAKKGDESLGQRTIIVSGLTSANADGMMTATVSFGTDSSGGSGSSKSTSQTVTRASQKENWNLVGQTLCTPMDELTIPAGAKYLKMSTGGTYRFKIPEKVYLLNWVETWVTEEVSIDEETGEESTRKVTHNKTIQRYYYTQEERDTVYDTLKEDGPWETSNGVEHELVGTPSKTTQAGKAYIKIYEKVITCDLYNMQDTMLWSDTATVQQSGKLTITASSGSFTADTTTSTITQTLP